MTRKDSEKETDRPHYYSQFWLDVAAGRTTISSSKGEDETDLVEDEADLSEPELEPTPLRRAGRNHGASVSDGYKTSRTQTMVESDYQPEELKDTEENEFDLADDVEELELPDNVLDDTEEEMYSPEDDFMADEEVMAEDEMAEDEMAEDEDDLFFEDEAEDEEDEDEWGSRGRKKPKPGRQTKAPKPTRKPKREPRRGF
jgi:hypothetical protein